MKIKQFINKLLLLIYFVTLFCSLVTGIVGEALLSWFNDTFRITFAEIIYTIKSPLAGADTHFLYSAVIRCIPAIIIVIFILVFSVFIIRINRRLSVKLEIGNKRKIRINILLVVLSIILILSVAGSYKVLVAADDTLKITNYLNARKEPTQIYDDYYVFPDSVEITTTEKKNLIYIFLESMETTYASKEVGGQQPQYNYIPNLTEYANEEISFSNTDKLGGFRCNYHAGWTSSALFCCQSGIPFSFPIDGNVDFGNRESFAPSVVMLGDILEKEGYYQEFLCGSDATFGGRRALFTQHGNYNIYDLYTAIDNGYLTEEEEVWWGVEDRLLYDIAKDELTRLAELDQPFNLTFLTVDTHHVDGWVCELCDDEYPDRLANVVKCADNQIYDFIEWCKQQPWYDNTVIVIQGDHTRMDDSLVADANSFDRTVYNCFINTSYDQTELNLKNRVYASLDMFPTVLGAMGYVIEGDRLGLGTNMFSDRLTLCEELGFDYVNTELSKYSAFFEQNFY